MTKTLNDKIQEADQFASRYLGDFNERTEAGRNDATAERLYAKAQFWLDRLNKLQGDA